jgi:hypothetical protein
MRKLRVYLDTSVFGGVSDEEFSGPTASFFRAVLAGRYTVLVSEETVRELGDAPQAVKDVLDRIPGNAMERVALGPEVEVLAQAYVSAGVVGQANQSDAIHVAAATVARADLILSWNFRHIVNYSRIRGYNGVNALNGYPPIEIHSPLEVADGDEGENV